VIEGRVDGDEFEIGFVWVGGFEGFEFVVGAVGAELPFATRLDFAFEFGAAVTWFGAEGKVEVD